MLNEKINDIVRAPPSVVRHSAQEFAEALVETEQYLNFEAAAERLNKDTAAQEAMQAFQNKQQALQMMMMLNAVSPEEQVELEVLRAAFMGQPSVNAYFQAQLELNAICQTAAGIISQATGLNYAASCGSSCCGQGD